MADMIGSLLTGLAELLSSFFEFLLVPIKYVLLFFEGVFYLIYRIGLLLGDVLHLFFAMLQAVLAVLGGIFRTIGGFIAWSGTPTNLKVGTEGFGVFVTMVKPYGLLDVLPILLLALDIFLTGYLVLRMVKGDEV